MFYVMALMQMGRDDVSELRPPAGLLFITQVMEDHGGMISTKETPDSSIRAF
jgi:hypothetical protein